MFTSGALEDIKGWYLLIVIYTNRYMVLWSKSFFHLYSPATVFARRRFCHRLQELCFLYVVIDDFLLQAG
ncbi:hypothetical protein Hanom_Chr11g00979131 [Helianthus anomalus]